MDKMSNFAERLKEIMLDTHTDIKSLAETINVNAFSIRKWLTNQREATLESHIKLADYFNCSLEYLTGRDNDSNSDAIYKTAPPFAAALKVAVEKYETNPYNLSIRTGISRTLIKDYLKGKRKPAINNVIKIAKALDCRIDELVGRE